MRNLAQPLHRHAAFDPDRVAIRFEAEEPISYQALDRWADEIAHKLVDEYKIGCGDRVAWVGMNHPAMIATLYACARIGAVLVPVNWRLSNVEITFIIHDCAPNLLIYGEGFKDAAIEAGKGICNLGSHNDLAAKASNPNPFEGEGHLSDLLMIVYTSGTTGRPKGAMLGQESFYLNALNSIDAHAMRRTDRILINLPMFHVGGWNVQMMPGLFIGAEIILHEKFDAAAMSEAIISLRPDLTVLVPVTMKALLELPNWREADYSSIRVIAAGSSVVPVEYINQFEEKGLTVIPIYGSTESGPVSVYPRPGDCKVNPRTMGRPGLLVEIRLMDIDGNEVTEPDTDGEIEIRGGHLMQGYWKNEAATKAALRDGWFRSGDICQFDTAGFLYFQDRQKNLIISGGENIYPAEVERVLLAISGVTEASVIGMPDPKWGEVPVAVLAIVDNGPDQVAIAMALEKSLARFKQPRQILFVEELPRNTMGKVLVDKVRAIVIDQRS